MTANPLMMRQPSRPGRVTVEMLQELTEKLNKSRFVKDSGLPYFVGRRVEEDGELHFLDRRTFQPRGLV
jgi:hypothetical protein